MTNNKPYVKADLEPVHETIPEQVFEEEIRTSMRNHAEQRAAVISYMLDVPEQKLTHEHTDRYEGTWYATLYKDGYIWLITDEIGSCSHCDPLLRTGVKHTYQHYAARIREAYAFETPRKLVEYFQNRKSGYLRLSDDEAIQNLARGPVKQLLLDGELPADRIPDYIGDFL